MFNAEKHLPVNYPRSEISIIDAGMWGIGEARQLGGCDLPSPDIKH
jgi:hypothetical protein